MAVYIFPTVAGLGSLGQWENWGTEADTVGYATVVETFWGPAFGVFFVVVAILAQCSIFNTYIASGSRGFFSLADDYLAPPVLVKCDKKHGVPYIAVLTVAISTMILCMLPFGFVIILDVHMLIASYVLALQMALVRGKISEEQCESYIKELKTLPDKIGRIIEDKERLQWFASKQANAKDIFFIGRGIDYAICLEGSLKMKEISYIHSEAYAAGELKHGTISLIEDGTLVIGVLTQPELYEKTVSNMVECRSRGAYLMGLTTFGNYNIEDTADFTVYIPKTDPHFATSLAVIPLQLLGYYVSVNKGLDVDKPRNLAKSVTVE